MKKIILAFDSFKGSASSLQLAEAAAEGVRQVLPDCRTVVFPIADGGEGTVDALRSAMHARTVTCSVTGPLGEPLEASYALAGTTALVELASAAGLTLVPEERRNPLRTTTFGVGQLIADAVSRGCRHIVLGLGGSATNDAGTGILAALGYRFLDSDGQELPPVGASLAKIAEIDSRNALPALCDVRFTLACDVANPFCGPDGAAAVYAHQKGALPADVAVLDAGMRHYASVLKKLAGRDIADVPGAGAAGGVAGGLLPFVNASIRSGIDTVLDLLRFDDALDGASLVITGEGRIDAQSSMGKAVGGILARAAKRGVPVVALAGQVADASALLDTGLAEALCIYPEPIPLSEAMRKDRTLAAVTRTVAARLFHLKIK
ncbi:MAG: glycerate kinase [Muribaculaceae bacterium]|nr:glycerate kinase [Muribaculaceae bacterium]